MVRTIPKAIRPELSAGRHLKKQQVIERPTPLIHRTAITDILDIWSRPSDARRLLGLSPDTLHLTADSGSNLLRVRSGWSHDD